MTDLRNKIVLITGAASGIGKASSLEFARAGSDLVLADVNEVGLKTTAEMVLACGRNCLEVRTDVSRRDQVEKLSRQALDEFGRVDILINNAGVTLAAEIKDMGIPDWEWVLNTNLGGAMYTIHYLLPQMIGRNAGHIVNVCSASSIMGIPAAGAYTASKHGLAGLTEVLRTEVERFGVKVTAVYPGVVKSAIYDSTVLKGFEREATKLPGFLGIAPEEAARKIVKAIKKDKAVLMLDFSRFVFNLKRTSPFLTRQFARAVFKRLLEMKI